MKNTNMHIILFLSILTSSFAGNDENINKRIPDHWVTINFQKAKLTDVLRILVSEEKHNLVFGGDVKGEVTLKLDNVSLETALDAILHVNDYEWFVQDNIIVVQPRTEGQTLSGELTTRLYRLEYISGTVAMEAVKEVLSERGSVKTFSSTRYNEDIIGEMDILMVTDIPNYFNQIQSVIEALDISREQINLSVKFIETNLKENEIIGIDWNLREKMYNSGNEKSLRSMYISKIWTTKNGRVYTGRYLKSDDKVVTLIMEKDKKAYAESKRPRLWTDKSGNEIKGVLGKKTKQEIVINRGKKEKLLIRISSLSENDQDFLTRLSWDGKKEKTIPMKLLSAYDQQLIQISKSEKRSKIIESGEMNFTTLGPQDMIYLLGLLANDSETKLLQEPLLTTMNNTPAKLLVGTTIPYPMSNGKNLPNTYEDRDINVSLNILPRVNEEKDVFMKIDTEVQLISGYVGKNKQPIISTRSASMNSRIKNGETLLIRGLMFEENSDNSRKPSLFGNIPVIKKQLLIFITPEITVHSI